MKIMIDLQPRALPWAFELCPFGVENKHSRILDICNSGRFHYLKNKA